MSAPDNLEWGVRLAARLGVACDEVPAVVLGALAGGLSVDEVATLTRGEPDAAARALRRAFFAAPIVEGEVASRLLTPKTTHRTSPAR